MTRSVPALFGGLCAAILLAGCTSGSGSGGGDTSAGSSVAGGDAKLAAPAGVAAASRAPAAAAIASGTTSSRQTATGVDARLAPDLIVTAAMTVSVTGSIGQAAGRAEAVATAAGGRADSDDRSTVRTRHTRPTADLSLRVPNSQVTSVLDRLAALGRERTRQLGTRDVTSEVVDVASRVVSARQAIVSLNRLYQRATRVRDVISIETSLAAREAALESLEARQRVLQGQTALATITLSLVGPLLPARVAPTRSHTGGFVGGLRHGWHAFVSSAVAVATALGAVLPFAALLLVLGALALGLRRRMHAAPTPQPDADV